MRPHTRLALAILLALALLPLVQAISVEEGTPVVGAAMHISADFAEPVRLVIHTPAESYQYLTAQSPLSFIPTQTGEHTIELVNGTAVIESLSVQVAAQQANWRISIDKAQYALGENVLIRAENIRPEQAIVVVTPSTQYRYLGIAQTGLEFVPSEAGDYLVQLVLGSGMLQELSFSVAQEAVPEPETPGIITDRQHYVQGESVSVLFSTTPGPQHSLVVHAADKTVRYLDLSAPYTFTVSRQGLHVVELYERDAQVAQATFSVGSAEPPATVAQNTLTVQTPEFAQEFSFKIRNHRAQELAHDIRVTQGGNKVSSLELGKSYDAEISPRQGPVRSIRLRSLRASSLELGFGVDEVPERSVHIRDEDVLEAFAIDTAGLDFASGTVTAVARGTALHKCAQWNFAQQRCDGQWAKVQDLTPGEQYSFEIFPGDPGYAETGVASINTDKAIYHPGESASLTTVVLDTQGYLVSGARVNITIAAPDGTATNLTSEDLQVAELSAGLYVTGYVPEQQGNYSLAVRATGPNVDSTMATSFAAQDYYEFDVLRDIVHTTDPWQGPFDAAITLYSYTNATSFTYVEQIPDSFSVIDTSGAIISSADSTTLLTWNVVNGTTVTYSAQPPLVTPDLYTLGPGRVQWTGGSFDEPRAWYLAIDPVQNVSGCQSMYDASYNVDGSVDWDGTLVDGCADDDGTGADIQDELRLSSDSNAFIRDFGAVESFIQTNHSVTNLDCQSVTSYEVCFRLVGDSGNDECWAHVSNASSLALQNTVADWEQLYYSGVNVCDSATVHTCITAASIDTCEEVEQAHVRLTQQRHEGGQLNKGTMEWDFVTVNYTVVTEPPTIALVSPDNQSINGSATLQFAFRPSDQTGIGQCNLVINGSANQQNTTVMTNNAINTITATLSDGDYYWSVNCSDVGGSNFTNQSYRTIVVDSTAPDAFSLSAPQNNTASNDSTPLLSWQASSDAHFLNYTILRSDDAHFDSSDTTYYTIGPVGNTTLQIVTAWSANRPHYWMVTAVDNASNTQNSTGWFNYTHDSTAPAAFSLTAPADATVTTNRTPLLSWSASSDATFANYTIQFATDSGFDDVVHTYYAIGGASNTSYRISASEQLADNTLLYWRAYALDRVGQGTTTAARTYSTDNLEPNLTLFLPQALNYTQQNVTLNYSAVDAHLSRCVYSIDTAANNSLSGCANSSLIASEGVHTLYLHANDSAGNANSTQVSFRADLTDPVVALDAPANNSFELANGVEFAFTATDANLDSCALFANFSGSWQEERANTSMQSGESGRFVPVALSEEQYLWNVRCNDTSGRSAFNSTNYTFTIDVTAPEINLSSPPNNTFENATNNINFAYNASEKMSALSSCALILNGAVESTDNAPEQGANSFTTFMGNGQFNWSVNCTDTNGLQGASLPFNITLDVPEEHDPPLLTLNSPVNATYTPNTTMYFNYTVQDASGLSNCSLLVNDAINATDENVTNLRSNNFTVHGFNDAHYTWRVSCTDNTTFEVIGNSSMRNFTIDTQAPSLSVQRPLDIAYASLTGIALNYTAFDANPVTCQYSLNGAANVSLAGCANATFNTTLAGRNNVTVHVNDSANNSASQVQYFNATANSTMHAAFSPATVDLLEESSLAANYTDEYASPVQGAACYAVGTFRRFVTRVGAIPTSAEHPAVADVYGQNVLRVDIPGIPAVASDYDLVLHAQRKAGTNDSLRAFINCDGTYALDNQIGAVAASDGVNDPLYGFHVLLFSSALVTNGTCSILLESNQSTSIATGWGVPDVAQALNPDASYLSTDGGSSFELRAGNTSYVDIGYVPDEANLTYNASSGLYELGRVHQAQTGTLSSSVVCSHPFALAHEENATLDVADATAPAVQITSITPQNSSFLTENVSITWAANDFELDSRVLRVYHPDGGQLLQSALSAVSINATAPGTYTLNAFGNDSSGNSANATASFTVHNGAPAYYDVVAQPASPQLFLPLRTYVFNVTWNDTNTNLANVTIEHNFTGTRANYTMLQGSGQMYTYNYTGVPGGQNGWRSFANDTSGAQNATALQLYEVQQNNSVVNLTINGTALDAGISEGALVTLSAYLLQPDNGSVRILQNGTVIAQGQSPLQNLSNFSTPGSYNLTAQYLTSSNYTANQSTLILNVRDTIAPAVSLETPLAGETDNDGSLSLRYNVSDSGLVYNCSLYINDTRETNTSAITKDTSLLFSASRTSGDYNWSVGCVDGGGNEGLSEERLFSVDITIINFTGVTLNCSDQDGTCNAANLNTTDADFEPHGTAALGDNFVYLNLSPRSIKPGSNITSVNISYDKSQALGAGDGTFFLHQIKDGSASLICSSGYIAGRSEVNCSFPEPYPSVDDVNAGLQLRANFYRTSQGGNPSYQTHLVEVPVVYVEDTTPPEVELIDPAAAVQLGAGNVSFNYSATDSTGLLNCTLYGDFNGTFLANETNSSPVSGEQDDFGPITLGVGFYRWNVECYDNAENSAFASSNHTINITLPDLTVLSADITFDNASPTELQNVTVNATLHNIGLTDAESFIVQFYDDRVEEGRQIGNNITIAGLAALSNTSVNTSFFTRSGPNNIFVVIDANESVAETAEGNNQANNTVHVAGYSLFYGNFSSVPTVGTQDNNTFRAWFALNASGNILAADSDSAIDFSALQALGRTLSGAPSSNDFSEADSALNMSSFNDTLSSLYTADGTPHTLRTYTLFGEEIVNVPVTTSAGSDAFVTGILWDTSKDSGNEEYDTTDAEPLVFIVEVGAATQGTHGFYNFELRVPSLLRSYESPDGQSDISLYRELT